MRLDEAIKLLTKEVDDRIALLQGLEHAIKNKVYQKPEELDAVRNKMRGYIGEAQGIIDAIAIIEKVK